MISIEFEAPNVHTQGSSEGVSQDLGSLISLKQDISFKNATNIDSRYPSIWVHSSIFVIDLHLPSSCHIFCLGGPRCRSPGPWCCCRCGRGGGHCFRSRCGSCGRNVVWRRLGCELRGTSAVCCFEAENLSGTNEAPNFFGLERIPFFGGRWTNRFSFVFLVSFFTRHLLLIFFFWGGTVRFAKDVQSLANLSCSCCFFFIRRLSGNCCPNDDAVPLLREFVVRSCFFG